MTIQVSEATARTKLFTQITNVRVEAGALLRALDSLEATVATPGHTSETVQSAADAWTSALSTAGLDTTRTELSELLGGDFDLHDLAEDTWSVVKSLSQLQDLWPAEHPTDTASLLLAVKETRRILRKVIYHCGEITVPVEVKEQLETLRVGKPLDFEASFKSKIPRPTQRSQILAELKNQRIGGWVDEGAQLIYRLSAGAGARFLTCIAPFALALLGAGLMYLIPTFSLPVAWNLGDRWQLAGAFGLVLSGAVIHLLVENIKQLQSRSVPIVAITDGIYWLNLRWIGLSLTVLWALVVAIGLRVIGFDSVGSEGVGAYIAAGYSLDSVAGLVLTRFDSSAGVLLRKVNDQVTGAKTPGGEGAGEAAA